MTRTLYPQLTSSPTLSTLIRRRADLNQVPFLSPASQHSSLRASIVFIHCLCLPDKPNSVLQQHHIHRSLQTAQTAQGARPSSYSNHTRLTLQSLSVWAAAIIETHLGPAWNQQPAHTVTCRQRGQPFPYLFPYCFHICSPCLADSRQLLSSPQSVDSDSVLTSRSWHRRQIWPSTRFHNFTIRHLSPSPHSRQCLVWRHPRGHLLSVPLNSPISFSLRRSTASLYVGCILGKLHAIFMTSHIFCTRLPSEPVHSPCVISIQRCSRTSFPLLFILCVSLFPDSRFCSTGRVCGNQFSWLPDPFHLPSC